METAVNQDVVLKDSIALQQKVIKTLRDAGPHRCVRVQYFAEDVVHIRVAAKEETREVAPLPPPVSTKPEFASSRERLRLRLQLAQRL